MQPHKDRDGYLRVSLRLKNNKHASKMYGVHRLVMMVFKPIKNFTNFEVNHLDFNKENNHVDNLEWCTRNQNLKHQHKHRMGNYKLSQKDIEEITNLYTQGFTINYLATKYNCNSSTIKYTVGIRPTQKERNKLKCKQ